MTAVTVHYQPKYPPIRPKDECACKPEHMLTLNQRLVGKGSKTGIACDATICMACGTVKPFAEFRHYHDALAGFWKEWGWHRTIGMRLTEFADLTTGTRFESYMALQTGMSPKDLRAYLKKRGEKAPKEPRRKAVPIVPVETKRRARAGR